MPHPVMKLPEQTRVLDLSGPDAEAVAAAQAWAIGRYDEHRPHLYTSDIFGNQRRHHLGIDLFGPAGTPVYAALAGEVAYAGYNAARGDYGHVVVLRHVLEGRPVWALYGHLGNPSLEVSPCGRAVEPGDVVGWLGAPDENGGWPPHLHIQLSWEDPGTHDMPGVVLPEERSQAARRYPDPRLLIGAVY